LIGGPVRHRWARTNPSHQLPTWFETLQNARMI
jgi:hypothetical protein